MIEFAFILGNGVTRLEVVPEELLQRGKVYGCNRIYEEFAPSVLVSTDKGVSVEIQQSKYSASNLHYTRKQCKLSDSGSNIIPNKYHGMSSGPAALGIASETSANYFYIIGMDLKGVNNKINNIYAGTKHYRGKDDTPTFFGNWVDQVNIIINIFKNKRYIHVNPLDNFVPDLWRKNDNYEVMNISEFRQLINNT